MVGQFRQAQAGSVKILGGLALLASLPMLMGCGGDPAPAVADEGSDGVQADVPVVTVVTPERTMLRRTTTQPATVEAYHAAEIYAKASGYLAELKVDIGQEVQAGDVLAVLALPEMQKQVEKQQATVRSLEANENRAAAKVAVAQANLQAAEALLSQAKADVGKVAATVAADQSEFERVQGLVERRAVADRLLDEARSRYESSRAARQSVEAAVTSAQAQRIVAEAQVQAAEAEQTAAAAETDVARKQLEELEALMGYSQLTAPFAGVVTARNVDPGDLVRNAQTTGGDREPLFAIVNMDEVRVRVAVPENDAAWANVGDKAVVVLRAKRGQPIEGRVSRVSRRIDEGTRTMSLEIDLENKKDNLQLLPGMYGEATLTLDEREALVLPASAVRFDEVGQSTIYIVDAAGLVKLVEVETGLDDGHQIEILSGLQGGERIIATPSRIQAGVKVRVAK